MHFISIYRLTQTPIQTLLIQFKSMFRQLYSPIKVWIQRIPFPLKVGTDKLNIHSSSNLTLNKISLNMFVKDFKHLSPPASNNSIATPQGPFVFLIFIRFIAGHISSPSVLLSAPSTVLVSMLPLYSFSTFINLSICSLQIFFRSFTLTFTIPLSSLRQLTPTTFFFSPILCLAILNNSQPSRQESTLYILIYYSLSIFFCLTYFFLSSSFRLCFQNLSKSLFLHTATSVSLFETTFQNVWVFL